MTSRRTFQTAALALALALSSTASAQDIRSKFDPSRDAAKDVAAAVATAKAQGKRVIVDVGGEWCPWCHILDRFVLSNADVKALVDSNYVWVKVNFSRENKNEAVLSKWPTVKGYPHLFVLDADGKLLHSQDTGSLEAAKDYDKAKFVAFLRKYGNT
ncbi:MAG: thioredoxin family protein [Ramlibacter sp.]|nr:thioredoxin family protein [Ramlibacter sp.]